MKTGKLSEKALLVQFKEGRIPGSKGDRDLDTLVAKALNLSEDDAKRVASSSKKLYPKEALLDINHEFTEARKYHNSVTVPYNYRGSSLLMTKIYPTYITRMNTFKTNIGEKLKVFKTKLEEYKAEQKALSPVYKESDYPTPEELNEIVKFEIIPDPISTTDHFVLQDLHDDQITEIKEASERASNEKLEEGMKKIYKRVYDVVKSMAVTLKDQEKTKFHETLVGNVQEMVELLPLLNITEDPKLEDLRTDLKIYLSTYETKVLKSNKMIRDTVAQDADRIAREIEAFM